MYARPIVVAIWLAVSCLVILAFHVTSLRGIMGGAGQSRMGNLDSMAEIRKWMGEPDEDVLQATRRDVRTFIRSKGASSPAFGLTRGLYWRQVCFSPTFRAPLFFHLFRTHSRLVLTESAQSAQAASDLQL